MRRSIDVVQLDLTDLPEGLDDPHAGRVDDLGQR